MANKSYAPTRQTIRRAQEKGKVYKSQRLIDAVVILLTLGSLSLFWPLAWVRFRLLVLSASWQELSEAIYEIGQIGGLCLLIMVAPLGVSTVCTLLLNFYLPRRLFCLKGIVVDFSRLAPAQFFKTIKQSLPTSLFALVLATSFLYQWIIDILLFRDFHLLQLLTGGVESTPKVLFDFLQVPIFLMLVVGLGDFLWQRFLYLKSLRLSFQEMGDEVKEQEGSPLMRAAVRSEAQRLMYERVYQKVAAASALIKGRS